MASIAKPLAGKIALVTGSTSGIGASIAKQLGAAGAQLVINGLVKSQAEGETIRRSFENDLGVKVALSTHDLSKTAGVEDMVRFCEKQLGSVDILVNNAGIQHISPVESFPAEKWDQIIAINLSSAFHASRLALPAMREKRWGRIINVASVHGLVASVNKSAYVAAKHGIVGFTKAVALETAGSGVTCNAICPGWVLTPLVQAQIDLRAKQQNIPADKAKIDLLSEKQPSKEFVQPDHLGSLAAFLCSEAASQMTGITMPMDGGWTAQ